MLVDVGSVSGRCSARSKYCKTTDSQNLSDMMTVRLLLFGYGLALALSLTSPHFLRRLGL
jgi:hypothetical protein